MKSGPRYAPWPKAEPYSMSPLCRKTLWPRETSAAGEDDAPLRVDDALRHRRMRDVGAVGEQAEDEEADEDHQDRGLDPCPRDQQLAPPCTRHVAPSMSRARLLRRMPTIFPLATVKTAGSHKRLPGHPSVIGSAARSDGPPRGRRRRRCALRADPDAAVRRARGAAAAGEHRRARRDGRAPSEQRAGAAAPAHGGGPRRVPRREARDAGARGTSGRSSPARGPAAGRPTRTAT